MIRYNANDPEIYGKKHFDILRYFGKFCMLYAACLFIQQAAYYYEKITIPDFSARYFPFKYMPAWFGEVSLFCFFLFWLFMAIAFIRMRYNFASSIIKTCNKFVLLYGFIYICKTGYLLYHIIPISQFTHSTALIMQPLYVIGYMTGDTCFWIYLAWTLKRLFRTPIFTQSADVLPSQLNTSEPSCVTLFEKWDPLYAYGKILVVFALWSLLPIGWASMQWLSALESNSYIYDPDDCKRIFIQTTLIRVCLSTLLCVCGYGLMRQKEWGRMLGLLVHALLPMVALIQAMQFQIVNVPIDRLVVTILYNIGYILPILCWGYIVCRTLCHPVVKYVCLRGGHDIE